MGRAAGSGTWWESPVGMEHMVTMDFSPLVEPLVAPLTYANHVGMGHIVAMDFSPFVEEKQIKYQWTLVQWKKNINH